MSVDEVGEHAWAWHERHFAGFLSAELSAHRDQLVSDVAALLHVAGVAVVRLISGSCSQSRDLLGRHRLDVRPQRGISSSPRPQSTALLFAELVEELQELFPGPAGLLTEVVEGIDVQDVLEVPLDLGPAGVDDGDYAGVASPSSFPSESASPLSEVVPATLLNSSSSVMKMSQARASSANRALHASYWSPISARSTRLV